MTTPARKILRNSFFGIASEAIGGALLFFVFILIARFLGSERFGVFSYILAFVGLFQLIADFGLTNVIVREISRAKDKAAHIMGAIIPLAWLFSLLIFGVIALLGSFFSLSEEGYKATLIMGVAVLTTFHSVAYGSVCRAFEEMGFNAVGNVTHKIVLFLLVLAAIHFECTLVEIAEAFMLANIYQMVFFYIVVSRRYIRLTWRFDGPYWRYLIKEAFPIGLAMIFRRITLHVDTLLLTALSTTSSVGLFNAAYKVIQMIDMIPFTLSLPLFPPFTRLAIESRERLYSFVTQALSFFMVIALPICALMIILAPQIVNLFFGSGYQDAAPTLRVLSCSVVFLFPTALYIYLFSALGHQKFYTISSAICLITKACLDIWLIPLKAHYGAAIATLSAEIAFFLSGAIYLWRLGYLLPYLRIIYKPLFAVSISSLALMIGLFYDKEKTLAVLIAMVCLYGVLYFLLILAFGAVSRKQLTLLEETLRVKHGT
ncbi:MAG: flippase [Methylosarcina sp.]